MGYNDLQSNKKKAKRPIIINRYFTRAYQIKPYAHVKIRWVYTYY